MNNWSFTGNLGKDSEIKYLPSGATVCEFSVAVESGYGDKAKPNWVRCALFGKRAEGALPSYLLKGAQVAISGELEIREWEGQNGKQSMLSVNVSTLDLIGGNNQQQTNQGAPQQRQAPQQNQYQAQQRQPQQQYQQQQGQYQQQAPNFDDFDDDIPF